VGELIHKRLRYACGIERGTEGIYVGIEGIAGAVGVGVGRRDRVAVELRQHGGVIRRLHLLESFVEKIVAGASDPHRASLDGLGEGAGLGYGGVEMCGIAFIDTVSILAVDEVADVGGDPDVAGDIEEDRSHIGIADGADEAGDGTVCHGI
jgi:hypothetical protein